jgi:hypothetical protein
MNSVSFNALKRILEGFHHAKATVLRTILSLIDSIIMLQKKKRSIYTKSVYQRNYQT